MRFRRESKLAELAGDGDHEAFDALFERHRPRLTAFCEHALGSADAAAAALPDVHSAARLEVDRAPGDEARARLWRAARQCCRRPPIALSGGVANLRQLSEPERSALLARELGDLSYDELAVVMDESPGGVKTLLVGARVRLAEASLEQAAA
jgi:DNA-directed RNA polymerase specialized sigma24 family protein